MGVISWIIFGFIVGLLARAILPGRDKMGLAATTVLGIVGAVFAGWVGQALGWYSSGSGAGIIASVIGAIVVLLAYNGVVRRRTRTLVEKPEQKDRDRFAA